MKFFQIKYFFVLLFTQFLFFSHAQYQLKPSESKMYVDGTSSLHNWTEIVEQMSGSLDAEISNAAISKITLAKIFIHVNSIKSGKYGMDDNTYRALKEPIYPYISYVLKSFAVDGSSIYLTGNLTIAGVTKRVKFKSEYQIKGSDILFKGAYTFKMTDFGVNPPTAVMGIIKTGEEIVIRFDLVYRK